MEPKIVLRGRDVHTGFAHDLLEVVPSSMGEVAVVTAVPTDLSSIVLRDEWATRPRPDVVFTLDASR